MVSELIGPMNPLGCGLNYDQVKAPTVAGYVRALPVSDARVHNLSLFFVAVTVSAGRPTSYL